MSTIWDEEAEEEYIQDLLFLEEEKNTIYAVDREGKAIDDVLFDDNSGVISGLHILTPGDQSGRLVSGGKKDTQDRCYYTISGEEWIHK